ncbi:hypothetical protein IFR05_000478 [Cadophora sp. M221]|nr:hypothetical protein IFR05_000478 [Cadophora sp. M221]
MPTQKRLNRSCILCHQRKIRCDKKSPCGNCTRADVLCCFPKPEQPVRRPHKTTIADVSSRLARLERTIQALAKESPRNGCADTPLPNPVEDFDTPLRHDQLERAASEKRLINGDCSSRYFNESFLSRILEEEKETHSLIGLQVDEKSQPEIQHTIELEPLLSDFHKSLTGVSYHPTRSCAIQLWQAFVNNVDPMIKIFHLPTTQAAVYAAIKNPNESGADTNALVFSIYFASTASLGHNGLANILGNDKNTALNHFKRGLEQSLAESRFLDTPNLVTLQAITLYIRCLRVFIRGRSLWSLNGLVVRCAQSIGLHRDGNNFKLSPFECELSRRLWWYIVTNDSRVGEDLGLIILNFDGATDVALPLNVNDNQLEPNMKILPPPELGWTEMSFTLIIMEVNKMLQEINQSRLKYEDIASYEAARQRIIHSLVERQERYLQYCDENIPAQRAAHLIDRILTAKLQFITRRHSRSTSSGAQSLSQDTEENFESACDILELSRQFSTDDMLEGFRWICQSFPQYNILMYDLWRLCKDVEGWNVERAWELVDASFEGQDERCHDWNWAVLEKLRAKARLMRTSVKEQDGNLMKVTGSIAESDDVSVNGSLQNLDWTSKQLDDYDWSALLENVDMQSYHL